MARAQARLKALDITRTKAKGLYPDGGGLYLQVSEAGTKSWIFRYRMNGRKTPRDMGLGPFNTISLADARQRAADARRVILEGVDPIEARKAAHARTALDAAKAMTFKACATAYIKAHAAGWRNEKHGEQWTATLEAYAHPVMGKLPVSGIEVGHVMKVLEPIWTEKPETASRVRGRIEAIIGWATANGFRKGDNPAQWRGLLENLLPKRSKVRRVQHHLALPYSEVGAFLERIRREKRVAALALEFLILTATRTSETIGARWGEIDLAKKVWTIPSDRIKAGKEHRIPLSAPALAILKTLAKARTSDKTDDCVFPGGRQGQPLSNNAMLALLKRINRHDVTVHGFRSTFRDWAAEQTNYPRDVAEMALAHAIGDKVEAAYRRGDLIEKRTRLMAEWAKHCGIIAKSGNVVLIRSAQ
jgi:integrase